MAKCPNCGREAARTIDWVCEWCAYPLPDGSFKKVNKTFRELREERQSGEPAEEEIQTVEEAEPPRPVKFPPRPQPKPEVKPVSRPEPGREIRLSPKTEPTGAVQPPSRPEPAQAIKPQPKSVPTAEVKPVPQASPPVETKPVPSPEIKPEPVQAKPVPSPEIKAESAQGIIEITVANLLSAYQTEGKDADARFANQTLRITGEITKINVKAALDIYSITLNSPGSPLPQGVRCVFDKKYGTALNQLSAGQTVTVQGKCSGSLIDISLRDCSVVR